MTPEQFAASTGASVARAAQHLPHLVAAMEEFGIDTLARQAAFLAQIGHESQDQWALQLIRERRALPLIDAGRFDDAVAQVRNLWASLPGAGHGQPEHRIEKLRSAYLAAGGTIA